ncbi:hypothetical protein NCS52_01525700 [Fusarium sp. LHS14.1]|nr:hypothetical protein NCS52_01525700 [Fusarium sp. LHS14.1]
MAVARGRDLLAQIITSFTTDPPLTFDEPTGPFKLEICVTNTFNLEFDISRGNEPSYTAEACRLPQDGRSDAECSDKKGSPSPLRKSWFARTRARMADAECSDEKESPSQRQKPSFSWFAHTLSSLPCFGCADADYQALKRPLLPG